MKYIYVDFDDTLCVHSNPIECKDFRFGGFPFKDSVPNKKLIDYLYDEKQKGATIILLTYASSFMLKLKKDWIEENCPYLFDDFVGVSIDCLKSDYIQEEDAMLIDDNPLEKPLCKRKGIKCYSPQYLFCKKK